MEVAGVERLRIDDGEGELELFEEPAYPAGGHQAAVLVVEGDAFGVELDGFAGWFFCNGVGVDSELLRCGLEKFLCFGRVGEPEGAGSEFFAVDGCLCG